MRLVDHKVYEFVKHLYRFVKNALTDCKDEGPEQTSPICPQPPDPAGLNGEESQIYRENGFKLR